MIKSYDFEQDYTPTKDEIESSLNVYRSWLEEEYAAGQDVDKAILVATDKILNTQELYARVFRWLVKNDYASIYDVDFSFQS